MIDLSASRILSEVVQVVASDSSSATHFLLFKGEKLRYMIAVDGGFRRLTNTLKTYSIKMMLLKLLLMVLPLRVLRRLGLGCFARVTLHPVVEEMLPMHSRWNMIVGTYRPKQKLVMQCWSGKEKICSFLKIGNSSTAAEMETEMHFLEAPHHFKRLVLPTLLKLRYLSADCPFNLMLTREFRGEKVAAELTPELLEVQAELAADCRNGLQLSHGDFAPWNLRRIGRQYLLFDWEFCDYRMPGYDLLHFLTITERDLNGLTTEEACDKSIVILQRLCPGVKVNKGAFLTEFLRLMQQ